MGGWVFLTRIASASSAVRFPGPSLRVIFCGLHARGSLLLLVDHLVFAFCDFLCYLSRVSRVRTTLGSGGRVNFLRPEDGRRKDDGGSGESRVMRSILPPVTKTLLFLLRSFLSRVRVSSCDHHCIILVVIPR